LEAGDSFYETVANLTRRRSSLIISVTAKKRYTDGYLLEVDITDTAVIIIFKCTTATIPVNLTVFSRFQFVPDFAAPFSNSFHIDGICSILVNRFVHCHGIDRFDAISDFAG